MMMANPLLPHKICSIQCFQASFPSTLRSGLTVHPPSVGLASVKAAISNPTTRDMDTWAFLTRVWLRHCICLMHDDAWKRQVEHIYTFMIMISFIPMYITYHLIHAILNNARMYPHKYTHTSTRTVLQTHVRGANDLRSIVPVPP